jgi:type I restriction enzyme S subunit
MPDGWRACTLSDVVRLQRGFDLPTSERRPGSVPILGSFGVTGWHDVAPVNGPGVTIGRSGASIGIATYADTDYWPLNTTLFVRDFHGNEPRFVYYLLKSINFTAYNSGSAQPSLNRNYIVHIPVKLPPQVEQSAIAEVLGALDDKIACNDRIRSRCDELLQAMFQRTAAPALFHLAGGAVLPPGWLAESLGDWLRVLETGSRPKGGVGRYISGVPSLGAESMIGLAQFDFSKTKYVPYDYFAAMKRGVIEDQDVLLYKDGGRPGEFEPHVAMLGGGFPFEQFCINGHVYRLRARAPLTQEYLFCWLSSPPLLEEMRRRGTGVAVPGLNSSAVKALPIVVPPPDVLVGFAGIATSLVRQALAVARESRSLTVYRDFLLPKLLSGELSIRSAEGLVDAV